MQPSLFIDFYYSISNKLEIWSVNGSWNKESVLTFPFDHMLFFWGEKENNGSGNAPMLSHFSRVRLFATQWTVARQAPLSMGFSRQEYWSGLPSPAPGDLPNQGIKPLSLMSPWLELAGRFFTTSTTWTVAEQQSRETSSSSSGGYSGDRAQSSRSSSHNKNCEWLFARDCAKDKNLHYVSHCPCSKLEVQLTLDLSYLFQQKSYLVSHPMSWDACAFLESIF